MRFERCLMCNRFHDPISCDAPWITIWACEMNDGDEFLIYQYSEDGEDIDQIRMTRETALNLAKQIQEECGDKE